MMQSERYLVTGAVGMLGRDLVARLRSRLNPAAMFLTDVAVTDGCTLLDISDEKAVAAAVREFRPDWIINCAAYTNVDGAEKNYSAAFAVNSFGPLNLSRAVLGSKTRLLHISTDYVFGGTQSAPSSNPLGELSPLAPCGVYGYSKAFGDQFIQSTLPAEQWLILRTSWLHGKHGPNFVHTMLRLGREQDELRVVDDQIGSPTWTGFLADSALALIERQAFGIFNVSSRGGISWYEFTCEIMKQAGLPAAVKTMTSAELNRPAPRPPYSTLDVSKLETFLGEPCPDWRKDLREHLADLAQQTEGK